MAPLIALNVLEVSERPLRVLDPMAGSGTVLAVARALGHRAYGFDADPLAVLMSRVWTTSIDPATIVSHATKALERARKTFCTLRHRDAYPVAADDETRAFVRYWFDSYSRRQLASLALAICDVSDPRVRDALWCAFSRLIITKQSGASRALDLAHSRPHRVFERAPLKPFNGFFRAISRVAENCPNKNAKGIGPPTKVLLGDARQLPLCDDSVDLVLTSPPYLNAIDYLRSNKFSLVWMGYQIAELRTIRAGNIGSELKISPGQSTDTTQSTLEKLDRKRALPLRRRGMVERYVHDMDRVLAEVVRVLRPKGRSVFVIGDSSLRGTFIRNSNALTILAERVGLTVVNRVTRQLPPNRRYLPPPSAKSAGNKLQARMRTEVVLTFEAA